MTSYGSSQRAVDRIDEQADRNCLVSLIIYGRIYSLRIKKYLGLDPLDMTSRPQGC